MILTDNTYSLYLFGHRFEIAGMMKHYRGTIFLFLRKLEQLSNSAQLLISWQTGSITTAAY
jgi:hypothetical protein